MSWMKGLSEDCQSRIAKYIFNFIETIIYLNSKIGKKQRRSVINRQVTLILIWNSLAKKKVINAQTEAQLETNLITQLGGQGYDRINIPDEAALLANLKLQLEAHNNTRFSAENLPASLPISTKAMSLIAPKPCGTATTSSVMMTLKNLSSFSIRTNGVATAFK